MRLQTETHPKLKELEVEVGRFCFDMWRDPMNGRLLVLAGENGTGKSHSAKCVRDWVGLVGHGKEFVQRPNYITFLQCVYWEWPRLLDTFKEGGWDVIDDLFETPCLIIDELGGGHDPSRVGVDKLCQVLSRREKMFTLITTNVIPSAWEQTFDRRVASRFFRNSTLVDLSEVPDFNAA